MECHDSPLQLCHVVSWLVTPGIKFVEVVNERSPDSIGGAHFNIDDFDV